MSHLFDLVLRNAHCATGADTFMADIGVRDGIITALGQGLASGAQEVDAKGAWVTPGGVDGHCHLAEPIKGDVEMADDFLSGPRSAACGGTTTIIPFAVQQRGQSLREAVEQYHQRAGQQSCVDYAFHMILTDANQQVLNEELPALIKQGYTSFKIYMTYEDMMLSDREIINTLAVAREHGALVMVHAENFDCIAWLTERLVAAGHTAPKYHAQSRPMLVEREATHRAISFAELVDVPILIVHVSGKEAIEQIQWAQNKGLKIYAETCPQYLFLSTDDLGGEDDYEASKCICSPPPRAPQNQAYVWDGLQADTFSIFSSDHAPFSYADPKGKQAFGDKPSFDKVANGIPGLETRLPLLFSHGVMSGKISIEQFVQITSTNVAKMYGLYPRKGSLSIGADADFIIWDTETRRTIRNANLHHAVDYTPYEGIAVNAWPAMTFSRGTLLWKQGEFVAPQGHGQFLKCGTPQPAKPKVHSQPFKRQEAQHG